MLDGWGRIDAIETHKSMVSMIIPLLIHLDEEDKLKEEKDNVEPITIELPIGQLKIEEKEIQLVIIILPPKEKFDTKCVPWNYKPKEVDAITRSGRCYIPKESEHEKKRVIEEDVKQLLSIMRTSEYEVIERLRKMLAQISLLNLFKTSESKFAS